MQTSIDCTRRLHQFTSCLAGHPRGRQLEQGRCWVGKVQIKQPGWNLMWPLRPWHGIEARVVMLFACIGQCASQQAIYSGPFRRHQMTVLEIIVIVLHCFKRKACWPMCFRDFVQLLLWIRSVPVNNALGRHASVHHTVRPHVTARPTNVTSVGVWSPLLGLLSYLFPFRNTKLSMYWGIRRERH